MTTKIIAMLVLAAALGGCVAVPVEPGPAVYAAPPAVVVQPYYGYYGYYGYGGGWHRHWR